MHRTSYEDLWSPQLLVRLLLLSTITLCGYSSWAKVIDLSPAVTADDIDEFALSPDGSLITFVGTLAGDTADQLYVAPITGGAATRLTPDGVGDVDGQPVFTPDGAAVIARYGGGDANSDNQMYLMPADGSKTATQLTFNSTNDFDPQVSLDGTTLFYVDSRDETPSGGTDGVDLLYATSISDALNIPTPTLITPENLAEIDTGGYAQIGTDILFAADPSSSGETQFYRTAADGSGTPILIQITNTPGFSYDIDELAVTPDGQAIVFVADLTTDGVDELYKMPITGGAAEQLLPTIQDFTDVGPFVMSPDGSAIAFQADFQTNGVGEAYVTPITGGEPIRASEDLTGLSYNADVVAGVGRIAFTPDSASIVYLADGRANGVNEMYIVPNPLLIPEPTTLWLVGFAAGAALLGAPRKRAGLADRVLAEPSI